MERQKRLARREHGRAAFTLVELLVVITIIGMLIALLLPAVNAARERGRQTQCMSNQHNIALALINYSNKNGALPGWRNAVLTTTSGGTLAVPWTALILPGVERNDLWTLIKSGTYSVTLNAPLLRVFACPSDPATQSSSGSAQSSYTANGLLLCDPLILSNSNPVLPPQSMEYVSGADGTSYTLLLSENAQNPPTNAPSGTVNKMAHNWFDCYPPIGIPPSGATFTNTAPGLYTQVNQTFGFPLKDVSGSTTNPYSAAMIQFSHAYAVSTSKYSNTNPMIANINSAHGGGAVVAFCDGHVVFARDDLGTTSATGSTTFPNPATYSPMISVYQIMVTPDGSKFGLEPPTDESQYPR